MKAFLGVSKTPCFCLAEGPVIPYKIQPGLPPLDVLHRIQQTTCAGIKGIEMYPVVNRSAVHAATRCALAITILLPEFKLENIACEEGKKRVSLQRAAGLVK